MSATFPPPVPCRPDDAPTTKHHFPGTSTIVDCRGLCVGPPYGDLLVPLGPGAPRQIAAVPAAAGGEANSTVLDGVRIQRRRTSPALMRPFQGFDPSWCSADPCAGTSLAGSRTTVAAVIVVPAR